MAADAPVCRCGHPRTVHDHFHDRTYCGRCGPSVCQSYRRQPATRPTLEWLRRRLTRTRGWWP